MNKRKGEFTAGLVTFAALGFGLFLMPTVLAHSPKSSGIQSVTDNPIPLEESSRRTNEQPEDSSDVSQGQEHAPGSDTASQEPDLNAISREQAISNALTALAASGFDTQEFEKQPVETRYLAENAPAGDPVWAIVFRNDQEGYASAFGSDVTDEIREKIAAVGTLEDCVDENGTPGIRAHYGYTVYTLVEVNAFTGAYLRHGESIVALGEPLEINKTSWTPVTKAEWEQETARQQQLQKEMETSNP